MKSIKNLFIILIMLLCCSCTKSWQRSIQISSLKYEDDYIEGRLKNLTNKAYNVIIKFKVKSGTLQDNQYCFELLRPKDTINLKCLAFNMNETYKIEVETIELEEIEIPELKTGIIDEKTLEYYFEDIYDAHRLNFISFSTDINDKNYPYIGQIKYENKEIIINGIITKDSNKFSYQETFNTENGKLTTLFGIMHSNEDDFTNEIIHGLSSMSSIVSSYVYSSSIESILKRTDIDEGYCVNMFDWCIGAHYSNIGSSKYILFSFSNTNK